MILLLLPPMNMTAQVTLTDRSGKQSTYRAILRGFDPDKVTDYDMHERS